jgi:hypothetical protein
VLSLVLALSLMQAGDVPVEKPEPTPARRFDPGSAASLPAALAAREGANRRAQETAPQANVPGRRASLFSSPRVSAGTLVGRTAMGLALGSLVGGVLAGGLILVGATLTANGSAVPMALITPPAIILLGVGTALGAAMFGGDYGRDLLDALIVAVSCAALSVGTIVALFFLAPASLGLMVAVGAGLVFPALATPLLVQVFKPGDPQPTLALARF